MRIAPIIVCTGAEISCSESVQPLQPLQLIHLLIDLPLLIIDSTTDNRDDAGSHAPSHQEHQYDAIPVRGSNRKVVSRLEDGGSGPCLGARRTQLVDSRFSNGTSSFWREKGSPYQYSCEKRFPSIGPGVPVHRTKVRVLGEMETHPSDTGSHLS